MVCNRQMERWKDKKSDLQRWVPHLKMVKQKNGCTVVMESI